MSGHSPLHPILTYRFFFLQRSLSPSKVSSKAFNSLGIIDEATSSASVFDKTPPSLSVFILKCTSDCSYASSCSLQLPSSSFMSGSLCQIGPNLPDLRNLPSQIETDPKMCRQHCPLAAAPMPPPQVETTQRTCCERLSITIASTNPAKTSLGKTRRTS